LGPADDLCRGPTQPKPERALDRFCTTWNAKYRAIGSSRRADGQRLTVFFNYSLEVRKVIYSTNAIESLNYSLRKRLKMRGALPTDDSIVKALYLAIIRVA
jgi:putative transposase